MSKVSYYTAEGLKKLRDELNHLKDVERPKASNAIAEARDKGDLSENAEYDAAKHEQGLLELKISKLEKIVQSARIFNKTQIDTSQVALFTTVKIKNIKLNKILTYTIVSEEESDLTKAKISIKSPIGKGILGKKVGEIGIIKTPMGKIEVEIISIQ